MQPSDLTFSAGDYSARPLQLDPVDGSPEAAAHVLWKSQLLLGKLAAHKHYFTDYVRGCSGACSGFCTNQTAGCSKVKQRIAAALLAKDAIVWEVWKNSVDFCGILRLSEVEPGCNAKAHYKFWDSRSLKSKNEILLAWKEFVFGKLNLHRVTVEVPANAFVLAKHAVKYLGFGGQYDYKGIPVEGVMREAKMLDGKPLDILILGAIR